MCTGISAFSWCCSIKEVISSFRQISSGCSLNVLRLSMLMERICSTSPLKRCSCSWLMRRYWSRLLFSSAWLKFSSASLAAYATAIGVFNSCVMLFVKLLFISSSVFCFSSVRMRNQKENPRMRKMTNEVTRMPVICFHTSEVMGSIISW